MDIGSYLSCIELLGKETRTSEQQPESAPDLGVELIYILEILQEILPERLPDVKGVLAAVVAIHTFKFRTAILAVPVRRHVFAADSF